MNSAFKGVVTKPDGTTKEFTASELKKLYSGEFIPPFNEELIRTMRLTQTVREPFLVLPVDYPASAGRSDYRQWAREAQASGFFSAETAKAVIDYCTDAITRETANERIRWDVHYGMPKAVFGVPLIIGDYT